MAIYIGHASCDENGKSIGSISGDQTGKEVCIRTWYNSNWNVMLECTDHSLAKKAAENMKAICSNRNYGYSQPNRWEGYKSIVKNGIDKGKGDFDCSSLVLSCYILAGLNIPADGYTGNMRKKLLATGKFVEYTDKAHLSSDNYAKIGTIYLHEGHHVVMALEQGNLAVDRQYYKKYTGTSGSIVDALKAIGESSRIENRKKIAEKNGINGYVGTAAQNIKMLNLLKEGKLIKA